MTDTTIAQVEPVLVAIDIAKARHEVLIAVPGRRRRRRLTVLNQLAEELCPKVGDGVIRRRVEVA